VSADAKTRDKLKEIRDRLEEKRSEQNALDQTVESARDAFGEFDFENQGNVVESKQFHDVEEAVRAQRQNMDEVSGLERLEQLLLGTMRGNGNGRGNGWTPGADVGPRAYSNAHAMLANSETYQHAIRTGTFRSDAHFGTIVLGKACERESVPAWWSGRLRSQGDFDPPNPATPGPVETDNRLVPEDHRGLQPHILRPLSLLDLFPTGTTDSNMIEYVKILNVPFGADVVEEGELKPELGIEFEDETSPVRTIAGWIKVNRQAMDDMAGLGSLLNTLLPYEVRRKMEQQIIAGDGSGQELLGLLNVTGLGSVAADPSDTVADALLRGVTIIALTDQNANFVALNPVAWQDLAISKASGSGNYMFDISSAMGGLPSPTIWGLQVVFQRVLDPEHPIVGDTNAATILVREGVNLKTSDSDQDDFLRNRITILAETRLAFVVWRPTAFCVVELP
jgi:hypothetical protein